MSDDETASLFDAGELPGGAHLLGFAPDARARRVMLPGRGELVFGRGEHADVHIEDTVISRVRTRKLVVDGASVKLVDLGSRNGALVNGVRLAKERLLASRDVVTLGRASVCTTRRPPRPRCRFSRSIARSSSRIRR